MNNKNERITTIQPRASVSTRAEWLVPAALIGHHPDCWLIRICRADSFPSQSEKERKMHLFLFASPLSRILWFASLSPWAFVKLPLSA